jgi:hypothetical protein
MNVTINNQCTNIELTSLIYFTKDATRFMQFPQQVNANSIMKANFITGTDRNTFGGALLYHLRWKKDASIIAQLLVIWRCGFDRPYSHAWLIEHDITLDWNEDMLKRLYHVYDSQHEAYSTGCRGKWLLNDNAKLKTVCKTSYSVFEINVTISEENYLFLPQKPLRIDPTR